MMPILNKHAPQRRTIDRSRSSGRAVDRPRPTSSHQPGSLAEAAADYARLGWAVLPLHTIRDEVCSCSAGEACKSPGKHPLALRGVNGATKDVDEVSRIWRDHPDANIGIATGSVSNLLALDVDPRNGGRDTMKRIAQDLGNLPKTLYSETGGGGSHRFFCYPEAKVSTRHAPDGLLGLDLQSDGAFVVAPPSRHASGRRYRWQGGRDPRSMSLSSLPAGWLDRLQKHTGSKSEVADAKAGGGGVIEGGRNTYLTTRAGVLRHAGLSVDEMLAALKAVNQERCCPPLGDDEVGRIAESVSRYSPGRSSNGDEAEAVMQDVLNQHYSGGEHLIRPSDGRFWAFDGTRWAPLEKQVLSGVILDALQAMPARRGQNTASLMRQVSTLIEAKVAVEGDPLRFVAEPLPVINCRNGELWIGKDGSIHLRPHEAKSYLRHRLEVDYDPSATSPGYDEAVLQIFGKAPEPAIMAQFWDELMGYAMQSDRRVPLVVLGWGAGNNGKTGLLETLVRLIGLALVAAMPIGDIEKSRFSTGNLLGKLIFLDDDVRAGTRLPDGQLKRLSEAKTITGEHKFGSPFTFTVRTAIFMLLNNPPSLADLSYGMQRRLVVVPFDRSFKPHEAKPGLFKVIQDHELSGVLNRSLSGLRRVMERGWRFDPPEAVIKAKVALIKAANPVPAFVDECCERTGSAYIPELYDAYQEWARRSGITMVPQRLAFQRSLESLGFKARHGNRGTKIDGLKRRPGTTSAYPRRP